MYDILILLIGIGGLILGAEVALRGAMQIGEHYKISRGFLGLTVLAIGTDIPELFISVFAAIKRNAGIDTSSLVIGETIGTSYSQAGLLMGLIGLVGVITFSRKRILRDGLMLFGSVVLFLVLGMDGVINKTEGLIMLVLYGAYFTDLFREERIQEKFRIHFHKDLVWSFIYVISGFVILYFASNQTIESALHISEQWGYSQALIGSLIVGLGTSLPELATALTAIKKRAHDMAAGNLIGSTIFDILVTIGIGAAIANIFVAQHFIYFDLPALLLLSLFLMFIFYRRTKLSKKSALVLILMYGIYALVTLSEVITF